MNLESTPWPLIRSEAGPELKLFKVRIDHLQNPRTQQVQPMVVLDSPDAANVVALTPQGQLILVHQFRVGTSVYTLELPGGLVDPGEDPALAAQRELREETGYTGTQWSYLGKVPSNPVFQNAYVHHWLVTDAQLTHPLELDAGEAVATVLLPLEEAFARWCQGELAHPHTISGLLFFFQGHHPQWPR